MILALLLAGAGFAQGAAEDRWLESEDVLLGLNADGSLVNPDLDLGLRFDPDGAAGPVPLGSDVLVAGYPFELWSASWRDADGDAALVNASPYRESDLALDWDAPGDNGAVSWLRGVGATDALDVDLWVSLPADRPVIWFSFRFTARAALSDLWVAKALDPDLDATTGGYSTDNLTGDAFATAAGLVEARALALYSEGGVGGLCSWCTTPAGVLAGAGAAGQGDDQIGVAVSVGDLAEGEAAELHFVYGLASDPETALAWAEEAALSHDLDADGVAWEEDCDDRDPGVAPGLAESWDGLDNDCDGEVDEGTAGADDDGDGYAEADGDCDDDDPGVYPGADGGEVPDGDCDGLADDGDWPPVAEETAAEATGCGCATPGGGAAPAIGLLALALARRRR